MLKVYVTCNGIKKRCRKIERHMLKLGNQPLSVSVELMKSSAYELLSKTMKTYSGAVLHLDYVEISDREGGFLVETWKPFDDRHQRLALDVVQR